MVSISSFRLIATVFGLLYSSFAVADCVSPAGVEGQFQFNSPNYQVCDGNLWVSMGSAAPSGACSTAGEITNSAGVRFCNGSLYVSMTGADSGTSCSETGTFQYSPSLGYMQYCNGTTLRNMRNVTTVPTFVQQASKDDYAGLNYTETNAFNGTGNTTTGNTIVCFVAVGDGSLTINSVVATGSQSLTRAAGPVLLGGTAMYPCEVWYRTGITGTTGTRVRANFSGAPGNAILICNEYSGLAALAVDKAAAAGQQPGLTSTAGPVTTTSAKELIFAAGCWDSGSATPGSGLTARGSALNDCLTMDRVVTAKGSYSTTIGGATSTSSRGVNIMATFRAN